MRALDLGLRQFCALLLGCLFISTQVSFADDKLNPDDEIHSAQIRQWIDSGIDHFLASGEIPRQLPPDVLLNQILGFSQSKSDEFQVLLEDVFIEGLKVWYPRFYSSQLVTESNLHPGLEEYISHFRWVSRLIEKKEQRFYGRNDPTAILRIGLKVSFISRFREQEWEKFKASFRSLWSAQRSVAENTPEAQEAALFATIAAKYREYLQAKGGGPAVDLEAQILDFLDEVKVLGQILLKHDTSQTLHSSALHVSHLLIHSRLRQQPVRKLLDSKTFQGFSREVALDYATRSALAVRKFLENAELGKFRDRMGAFSRIRLAAVKSNGQHHLVFRADVKGAKASLVVINPPHRLQKASLNPDDPKLVKYVRRTKSSAIVIDLEKSRVEAEERMVLRAKAIMIRPGALNLKRYVGEYFLWAYEHPNWGQAFLASGSLLINGGLRWLALSKAVAMHPETHEWNNWAIGLALSYYFGCALFKRWYDNAFASDSLLYEATKKAVFSMFFTTAVFVWLTQDVSLWAAVAITLPFNFLDKMLSSLSQRLIRTAEREGLIRGDFVVYSNDVNPQYWRAVSAVTIQNLEREARNTLRSAASRAPGTAMSREIFEKVLDRIGADLSTRLFLLHRPIFQDDQTLPPAQQLVSSEADLRPEEFGLLEEDLRTLEENAQKAYEAEAARFREDGHEIVAPVRSGVQITPRFENGLMVREIDGGGRNTALSTATTISESLGLKLGVSYGVVVLAIETVILSLSLKKYKNAGNSEQVKHYTKKLMNVVPVLPWLFVKASSGCRAILKSLSSQTRQLGSNFVKTSKGG